MSRLYEFFAGCVVGFVVAALALVVGIASTKGARRWKP